jgi:predicted nucleic acid-binding protein
MKLVVDANVLFSALIKQGKTAELLLDLSMNLYTPKFILDEFEKYRQEIIAKTKRSEEEFAEIFDMFKGIIHVVPEEEFVKYLKEAEKISPDSKDIMYFALALKLNCPIWSNDKRLKNQDKIKVYSTEELNSAL